jgi:hypothetical protein
MTEPSQQLAKDVATELERRRRRRKLLVLLLIAALIAAAVVYLQCGKGWGLGGGDGKGSGSGSGSAITPPTDAGSQRCTVRVAANGLFVDGEKRTRDEVVEICKKTEGAMVTVTGDARQGDWDELRAALQAVGVKIYIRGQLWDGDPR